MTPTKQGSQNFHVVDVALRLIRSLRRPVARVRRHNARLATQIENAASSVVANIMEGARRAGRDRIRPQVGRGLCLLGGAPPQLGW
jgi:hypothetical protein